MFAGHHAAAQIHPRDEVEGFFSNFRGVGILAGDTDAHVVVQDIDTPPIRLRFLHGRSHVRFLANVGGERPDIDLTVFVAGDTAGFFRRFQRAVHRQDAGAFLRKTQHSGSPVTHAGAGALAGPDDDGDLILKPHFIPFSSMLLATSAARPRTSAPAHASMYRISAVKSSSAPPCVMAYSHS